MAPRLIADDLLELLPMHRAPGNHVSEILKRMSRANGLLPQFDGNPAQIMFEAGNTFEDLMAAHLARRFALSDPDRYIHGMELALDGITGNLDLLDVVELVVEECKWTKLSVRHDIESNKFRRFWWQLKTYTYMAHELFGASTTARLHMCHVMGNWSHNPEDPLSGYQYRCWEDTWSVYELKNHWRMVDKHRLL